MQGKDLFDAVKAIWEKNSTESLLIALGALGGGSGLLIFIRWAVIDRLTSVAKKTKSSLDDLAVDVVRRTHGFFIVFLAIYAASVFLKLEGDIPGLLSQGVVLAFLLQCAFWGNGVISFWLSLPEKTEKGDASAATTLRALAFLGRVVVWAVVLLLALANLGYNVTALMGGLGITGIAVALAVQKVLGDLLASISIVLDKPFAIGDYIIVGDLEGTVEQIGLKTTRVKSISGEQIVFSNSDLLGSRIRNYRKMSERRIKFSFGLTYQTTRQKLGRVPSLVKEIVDGQGDARFDRAHFKAFGDSSLDFEVVYYMTLSAYTAYMDTQHAINLALYEKFEKEGIEFAYPTRTIFVEGGEPVPS